MKTKESAEYEIETGRSRYRIEIYIPIHLPHTTDYELYHEVRLGLEEKLSKSEFLGGVTTIEGTGLFFHKGKPYVDQVAIIYTDTDMGEEDVEKYIHALLKDIADVLKKEVVILITYYPVKHAQLERKDKGKDND